MKCPETKTCVFAPKCQMKDMAQYCAIVKEADLLSEVDDRASKSQNIENKFAVPFIK